MLLVIYCIINEVELSYTIAAEAGRKSMILSQHTLRTSVCYCALRKHQKSKTQKVCTLLFLNIPELYSQNKRDVSSRMLAVIFVEHH